MKWNGPAKKPGVASPKVAPAIAPTFDKQKMLKDLKAGFGGKGDKDFMEYAYSMLNRYLNSRNSADVKQAREILSVVENWP